jgi:hypothetical protein
VQSNLFVVSGNGVTKSLDQLLPNIISQLGSDGLQTLMRSIGNLGLDKAGAPAAGTAANDDDVPDLVPTGENFEDASEN